MNKRGRGNFRWAGARAPPNEHSDPTFGSWQSSCGGGVWWCSATASCGSVVWRPSVAALCGSVVSMEASTLRQVWRAWAAGSRLSWAPVVLLLFTFVVWAPLSIGSSIRFPRGFRLTQEALKIVGSSNFPVKVYVPLHDKSPHVLCATQRLRNSELIDPSFQWQGPGGKLPSKNNTAQITSTGSLIFKKFEESMTGVYTCFLEYKPTVEDAMNSLQLKYVVYAYREPKFYYQLTLRYHVGSCNSIRNIAFQKKLLEVLSQLVRQFSCKVSLLKSECHRVKMQKAGFQNELFFTFSIAPQHIEKGSKPTCIDHNCEYHKKLLKAKNLIERFFNQQVQILGRRPQPLPDIYYIEGTLQMALLNRCFPGYGINSMKHPKCPECCVICSPGSYNPSDGTHCLQCNSSLVFGAEACL